MQTKSKREDDRLDRGRGQNEKEEHSSGAGEKTSQTHLRSGEGAGPGPRGCTGPPRYGHAPTPGPPCGPSWALAARLHPTRVLGRESRGRREEGGEAATGHRSRDEPCGHPPRTPEPRTPEPRQQIQGQGALCRWTLACQASPGPNLPELSCTSPTGAQLSPAAPGSPTASGAEARGGMGASPPGVLESTRGPSHGQLVPGGHFSALSGAGIAA